MHGSLLSLASFALQPRNLDQPIERKGGPLRFNCLTSCARGAIESPTMRRGSLEQSRTEFAKLISALDLGTVTARQRRVAKLRAAGLIFDAIGKRLGVSRERGRQIEDRLRSRARLLRQQHRSL